MYHVNYIMLFNYKYNDKDNVYDDNDHSKHLYLHPILLTPSTQKFTNKSEKYRFNDRYQNKMFATNSNTDSIILKNIIDEKNIIISSFSFDAEIFLNNIYGLKSFDDVINWSIDNEHIPFNTHYRIHNCAWRAFGKDVSVLTINVFNYYYEKIKNEWLHEYTNEIFKKYADYLQKNVSKKIINKNTLYEYIVGEYFTYNFLVSVLKQYINENQSKWYTIQSHYYLIKKFIYDSILQKIDIKNDI